MNLSAVCVCEIRVTACAADRLGQRFIPPIMAEDGPQPPALAAKQQFG